MTTRIAPLMPPYDTATQAMLEKWMPPGSSVEPLKLFRTLLRHPLLGERMRPLGGALLGRSGLPMRVRELLILRTCARCRATYEWGVHVAAFAAAAGLDGAAVDATVRRAPEDAAASSDPDDAILRVVDELHDEGTVGDATWALLAARFGDEALLEIVAVVGYYHLISFIANAARVEHEPWAAPFPASGFEPFSRSNEA